MFKQSQPEISDRIAPSTAVSEPTQASNNSPAVVVCGRKTAVTTNMEGAMEVTHSQVLPFGSDVPAVKTQQEKSNTKTESCPSDDDNASIRTERYSPVSDLHCAIPSVTAKKRVLNYRERICAAGKKSRQRPALAEWSTDDGNTNRFQKKKMEAKKVTRKRSKPALPVTKVYTVRQSYIQS